MILSSDLDSANISQIKEVLLEKSFKLINSMIQFNLNILKNAKLSANIIKHFNEANIDLISQVSFKK